MVGLVGIVLSGGNDDADVSDSDSRPSLDVSPDLDDDVGDDGAFNGCAEPPCYGNEDNEGDSGSNGGSNGVLLVGISIAAGVALVVAMWLLVKRRRPASDEVDGQAGSPSVRSFPRLPAPDEIIELANHTIHRLGLGTP